jgi:hypothetical protein
MLLALGVFATLFLVLLFGRGLWAILGRWSGWKDARKVPRTIRDLQAERDSLRAEKAMMTSKLDSSMSEMKLRLAEQMAEVSRNRNRLLDANSKMQTQSDEIEKLKNEVAKRNEKIGSLNTQIEENVKAISQAWAKTAEHESDAARAFGMHKEAITAVNIREDRIRGIESEAKALREIIAAFLPGNNIGNDIGRELPDAVGQSTLPVTRSLLTNVAENVKVLPDAAMNSFQARFNVAGPLASVSDVAETRLTPEHVNDEPVTLPRDSTRSYPLERGISNVLSLAERVRDLQKSVKN